MACAQDLIKAQQRTRLQQLTSPVDGVVQQLAVHTVGGVVTPAQSLLVIVPDDSALEIEAMVSNRDIGFIQAGQAAEIKIDTFNFTRYGLLHGEVVSLSQDAIIRDRPPERANERALGAQHDTSEPNGQELITARASLSIVRKCRSRTTWSVSPPAWPSPSRSRPASARSWIISCRPCAATGRRYCTSAEPARA